MVTPTPTPIMSGTGSLSASNNTYTYNLNNPNPFTFLSSSSSTSSHPPHRPKPPSSSPYFTHEKDQLPRTHLTATTQSKDSAYTYIHMHAARHAELFEDFCKDKLPNDDIYVAPQHQPVNPEDEDDVVPDQHAAFGITRALGVGGSGAGGKRGTAWKDLGLGELMGRGPGGSGGKAGAGPGAGAGAGAVAGGSRVSGGAGASSYRGLPR